MLVYLYGQAAAEVTRVPEALTPTKKHEPPGAISIRPWLELVKPTFPLAFIAVAPETPEPEYTIPETFTLPLKYPLPQGLAKEPRSSEVELAG